MNVWVLCRRWGGDQYLGGDHSTSIHATKELAEASLYCYIRDVWNECWPESDFDAFDDPVEEYFARCEGVEWYNIYETEVGGSPPLAENECILAPSEQEFLLLLLKNVPLVLKAEYREYNGVPEEDLDKAIEALYHKLAD